MAALVAMIGIQTAWLRGAQSDVRALRAEVAQFRAAYDALAGSVQRQNAAVNEWQAKAEQAAQAGRRAREEAGRVVAEHRRSADALAAAAAAPAAGLACVDAVGVVRADLRR
jgi:phage shock protein A